MFSTYPRSILLILFGLIACSDSTSNNPNIPEAPPTETGLTALVVGEATSPFLDILEEQVGMTQDDSSQKVTDYDLLIFDGDAHAPIELKEHPRLEEALKAGKWVMVADVSSAHKREGLSPHTGFATKQDTDAYLVRNVSGDMPVFDIMEMPLLSSNELPIPNAPLSDELKAQLQEHQHRKFAERVLAKIGATTATQQSGSCATPLNIQSGIIYATWCYSVPNDWQMTSVSSEPNGGGTVVNAGDVLYGNDAVQPQSGQVSTEFTYTLLLNNANNVTGDSQTLHASVNGQMTPTTTTWPPDIDDTLTGKPYLMGKWINFKSDAFVPGYLQDQLEVTMGPDVNTPNILQSAVTFAPQTPNNEQTDSYSSSTSFSVGATLNAGATPDGPEGGGAISGSYSTTSTNTQSEVITDWTWTANLSGDNTYDWVFSSQNPPVGVPTPGLGWDGGWNGNWNALNDSLMQFSTEAVWTTQGLSSATLDLDFGVNQHLVSLQTQPSNELVWEDVAQISTVTSIDLSMVNPVTLLEDSLSFTDSNGNAVTQDNPVSAGENVTATVDLSGAAPFSYNITSIAISENYNAVVTESPVRITMGESSQTFTIETNENGLGSGDKVAVPIFLGSFGSTAAQQLWIIND